MSTVVYGALSRKRAAAPSNTSTNNNAPALRTYADSFSALVPAEALAILHVILPAVSDTETVGETSTITITDPGAAQLTLGIIVALTFVMYAVGRVESLNTSSVPGLTELAKPLIPAAALVGWIMLEQPELFATTGIDLTEGMRVVIAVAGSTFLGLLAAALGIRTDGQKSTAEGATA